MNDILVAIERMLNGKMVQDKEYLDVSETCFLLGISKSTLYKMNHHNGYPRYKSNGIKKCTVRKNT